MKFHIKRMPFFFSTISRFARTASYAAGANLRTFTTLSQSDTSPKKSAFKLKSYNTDYEVSKSDSQILPNKSVSWSDGWVKEEQQLLPSQIPLVFKSVQFVHEKSDSSRETLRGGVYYQGDKVIISHIIEGYCLSLMNDVCIRSTSRVVDSHCEIFYSNAGTQTLHFENDEHYQKVLLPAMFFVQLPSTIPVGEYQIMLIVDDVYGKRATSISINFKIISKSNYSVAKAILSLLFL